MPFINKSLSRTHIRNHFLRNVNKHLETLNLECIENGNISVQHLGRKGLHLNSKGKGRLALNFLNQIRKF